MATKQTIKLLISLLIIPTSLLILLSLSNLSHLSPPSLSPLPSCDLFTGKWTFDPTKTPTYNSTCPFHRNSWNCLKNKNPKMGRINNFKWVPKDCVLDRIDPVRFLGLMRDKRVGFVGDSLSENLVVAFLCVLRNGDYGARKWKDKRNGVWRDDSDDGVKGTYRVDVDIPADDWAHITSFYDVLIFNTGHWWGYDKFPKETPLVFYKGGEPINPPLEMMDGFEVVLKSMVSYIEREVPANALKFWRLQSPRHFYGGEWNQNGSCLFDEPLDKSQLDLWFDPSNNGVNKEARLLNGIIKEALREANIQLLDLTHLSEFRADAHPAIWLGKKDAVSVWGQDCLHWCLPGVPDTWVDIISELILQRRL